eukprot:5999956-Pleurochrysis_carterae.AAC.7
MQCARSRGVCIPAVQACGHGCARERLRKSLSSCIPLLSPLTCRPLKSAIPPISWRSSIALAAFFLRLLTLTHSPLSGRRSAIRLRFLQNSPLPLPPPRCPRCFLPFDLPCLSAPSPSPPAYPRRGRGRKLGGRKREGQWERQGERQREREGGVRKRESRETMDGREREGRETRDGRETREREKRQ